MKGLFCASLIFASSLPSCGSNPQPKKTAIAPTSATTAVDEPILAIETSEGIITVKLYKETPLHRDNFVKLAAEGFYDGIIFHRVIRGFMIQTGDPQSKNPKPNARYGTGGPGYNIPAEILPQLKHKKGALAAARTGDHVNPKRESSGSQFYIVENPASCAQLDGAYTVFGETISGFDVIDKIAATATDAGDRPVKDVIILSVKPVKK
ncbi:MAG: peptidylprolyl isomerase [Prevotellaceae bacterium]|nr:peptidylprolyl isomerase [Prevotellaceae bacterium]